MPSTYTTNGGIELPANGEQSGTWGETVNDNMAIIDRLTNGVGAISLSGTTHTLTTADGTLSDGQYNVLVLGGSPSGTNTITISPNDGEHVYIVKNASGQTATFTQGSGANVSVLNNTTKIIYADGAGAGAAVVDITGALDLGSLIIAGTTTITAVLDEDNMASDSATALATQQSIKAYVDAQVGTVDTLAEILAIGNTTGGTDIVASTTDKVQFRDAAIYINSSVDGQLDIVADTEIQIAATTIDVNGALDVSGTALVTGVLTTTAATVSNGGGQFNGAINVGVDDTGYDVKFFGATAGAYMLWDESADDLILGGAAGLSVNSAALVTGVLTANGGAVFNESGADVDFRVESDTDANALFVQGSDGFVGIGTSSPEALLHVDAATNKNFIVQGGTGDVTEVLNYSSSDGYRNLLFGGSVLRFETGAGGGSSTSEAMRIDSSGDVLVGKTSNSFGTTGVALNPDGSNNMTRASDPPLALNRLTSDGSILGFYKDGTTVGSIASRAGVVSTIILDPSSPGGGISGGGSALYPTDHAGTLSDGVLTLGDASARWNNLYLSGGVYLGGTVAANKLDDYEEGTFTPSVSAASGSYTSVTATGKYIKVGRSVTIRMRVVITTNGTAAGAMFLGNIPFPTTDSNDWGGGTREDVGTGDGYVFSGQGTTAIYINKYDGTYGLTSGRGFTCCISYIAA
jgi:hypothetical protein